MSDQEQAVQPNAQEKVNIRPDDPYDILDKGGSQFSAHFHGRGVGKQKETADTRGIAKEDLAIFQNTGEFGKLDVFPVYALNKIDEEAEKRGWDNDQRELVYLFNEMRQILGDAYTYYQAPPTMPGFEDGWRLVPAARVDEMVAKLTEYKQMVEARAAYLSNRMDDLFAIQLPEVRERIRRSVKDKAHIDDSGAHADVQMQKIKRKLPRTPAAFQRMFFLEFGKKALKTPGLIEGDLSELEGAKIHVKGRMTMMGDYMLDTVTKVFKDIKDRKVVNRGSIKAHANAFTAFEEMNLLIRNQEAADLITAFKDYHDEVDPDELREGNDEFADFKEICDDLVSSLEDLKGREVNPFGADGRDLF